jgi:hypothetical protein
MTAFTLHTLDSAPAASKAMLQGAPEIVVLSH